MRTLFTFYTHLRGIPVENRALQEKGDRMMEEFLLLIDGSSLLTTQFFGNLPREILFAKTQEEKETYYHKIMMTSEGVYTNAVFGFMRTLLKILKEQKPSHLAVAWDLTRDTFRRELYADYKGNRSETMEPLKQQFALCQQVLADMNVVQLMNERYEADDFCGTAARLFEAQIPVRILTKDNDYLQLITDRTNLWLMHSTAEKTEELFKKYHIDRKSVNVPERAFNFTPELVEQEFGIPPCHVNSLKGLMGDASDNIKGVAGVGPATAVKLIQEYGTVEKLYEAIDHLDKDGEKAIKEYWKEKLELKRSPLNYLLKTSETELVGKAAALLSEQLATIKTDVPFEWTLEDLRIRIQADAARKNFEKLEFRSLKVDLEEEKAVENPAESFVEINDYSDAEAFFAEAARKKQTGLAFAADAEHFYGIAAAFEERTAFIPAEYFLTEDVLLSWAEKLFQTGNQVFVMEGKAILHRMNPAQEACLKDVSVAAYLLDPLAASYPYEEIASRYLDWRVPSFAEYFGKQGLNQMVFGEHVLRDYACYQARIALQTGPLLLKKLDETKMRSLYDSIEMPLVVSLAEMEEAGMLVKRSELVEYGSQLVSGIQSLEADIYKETGEEFNILSPKQLGEVLFGHMKLPFAKKTKSGYSTSADVLDKLAPEYPVVKKILEYRQLTKLKSTYAEGLASCIAEDGRIHSTFNQTITATGRISSTEPNLQNIPVRMELGRAIRKVFVPKEGCIFIDADYSQIELRILAHMSGDESLIEAYRTAQDIHALTASQVFHVPLEEVTPLLRRNAKAVNFGIVYGISAFGLSEDLSISRKEALQYMEHYFETYPDVKKFLDHMVSEGQEQGYVTTLFGRRRPIPELKSSNYMQRQFGERVAMNSPIQGTAADIMKVAMNRVNRRLKTEGCQAKIILQVHDELLIEAPVEETEKVSALLAEEMEHAAELSVPLEVSLSTGKNWFETK